MAIVGQGYVGLPLAMAAAAAGHDVVGIDISSQRVEQLNAGQSTVGDVSDAELQAARAAKRYRASSEFTDVSGCDVIVICVPTPYEHDTPDLSFIDRAARDIGTNLRPDTLVILESTTFPGTTEEVLAPLLEENSGLRAGADFELVFSPERIDPGNAKFGLENTPKIVGGLTPEGTARAAAFYGTFVNDVRTVSGPKAAEMAKLLENTFRHINIALVNELAMLAEGLGVDIWEVIDAAASKPFGFMPFYPGPGVGGHCIPVDPMYLSWRVRQLGGAAKFIELARDVNDAMPVYCVARVQDLLNDRAKPLRGSQILVLGVAYKSDIGDMRESPALPLIEGLVNRGAEISFHDPHVPILRTDTVDLASVNLTDAVVHGADCVIVITGHSAVDYEWIADRASLVFDTRNVVPRRPGRVFTL